VQYNSKGVWSQLTPFWQKAAFLVPAAAAGAAAAVVVGTSGGDNDDGRRDGSVVIGFPE